MTNITSLRGDPIPSDQPNQALIETIRAILTQAEDGTLQSLYATGFRHDGLRMSCLAGHHPNAYAVIGSIESLKLDYISRYTEPL